MLIVHEDDNLLIADKPQGIPTAPGQGYSFCEAVFDRRPEINYQGKIKP
jgi:23S rRNA-/tRNA-specific pseudouridylate synthase